MTSGPDDFRSRVLSQFERCRAVPGAPFEEDRFLDYLLANPAENRAAYNSFAGLRRLNRFMEAVQVDFSICFSMSDRDRNYGLDAFVERVQELSASRQSSLASLRNRQKHSFGWPAVIFGNLLAFPVWMVAYQALPVLGGALIAVCAAVTGMAVRLYVHDRRYLQRLEAQIREHKNSSA